ncbi:LuxR family transcriptional regulator [Pseudomonas taiwanensis]|uniref:helix-turn-helix transcriptional regulator n=1 Tax=Pseudomonas taiwanensis TaxID=470150 RepID=UPI0015BE38B7|nr:LuxR C-terminal-related transcriptional regulator [Pseudomonas taiwanensis]NWL80425.1 LuxR family transcriptional regulator [Pseudomonas taiwanensis]
MHGQLTEWTRDVAAVLTRPPGQPQLQALTTWLQRLGFIDHFVLFIYEGRYLPLSLFDTFPAHLRQFFVHEYQAGPYRLDPFYLASQGGQAEGLHSMQSLAPQGFSASEYFRSYYRRLGLCEELGFFTSLEGQGSAVLSLMRRRGRLSFSEKELRLFRSAVPVVDEVVRSAWQAHRPKEQRVAYDLDERVRNAFDQFGHEVLSPRERQVARLVLQGNTNSSIAELLGIQRGTVKVHRKNLYDKLEIGSQAELLAVFIRELKGG